MNEPSNVQIRTEDALRFFETKAALARALNINPQAITPWGEFIPELRAFQLRQLYPDVFEVRQTDTSRVA